MKLSTSVEAKQSKQELIANARYLAQHHFAARASTYDREAAFPAEDLLTFTAPDC